MHPRSLRAAAIVLAALSGVVWWAKKHPKSETSSSTSTTVKLVDVPADKLQQISIKKKDGTTVSLKRQNGKWELTSPEALPADQDSVSSLTSNLAPMNADSVVEDKAADFAKYGLTQPALTISMALADGKTDSVELGDDAPAGSLVYARHASSPTVYALSSSTKTSFDKSVNDLRDKRLLTFTSDKLTGVELDAKKGAVGFAKDSQGDWQIVKPASYRADSFQVEELIRKLQDAKMDLSASADDQKKAVSDFATAQPIATAKVTDANGTQSLELRKAKTDYFAKSSVVNGTYKVASDVGTALDKTVDDFRAHKLFDFGFSDPTKLELRNGSSDTTYQKTGQDWKSNGKTMDASSLQAVIDQLRDLSASSFLASGFANPTIDVTVVSKEGKRTEKVSFAKSGDKYIAKRENEPSLYEITGKNVDDIIKAFGSVKTASTNKK